MRRNKLFTAISTALLSGALIGLAGCGGGGSSSSSSTGDGDTVTGLTMPTKLSVVTAAEDTSSKLAGIAGGTIADTSGYAADADYNTVETHTWVYDPSMDSLSIVNEILCYVQQTGAKEMVNQGAYVALVNEDKCMEGENGSGASSGGAQASTSSSTEATSYARWVIESTRESNTAPQEVKIWIPGSTTAEHPMEDPHILVEITINEGVSDDKPFGSFVLNFVGVRLGSELDSSLVSDQYYPIMKGTLKTVDDPVENPDGKPQFKFINLGGAAMGGAMTDAPFSMTQASNVIMDDATGTAGEALTYTAEEFDEDGDGTIDWSKEGDFKVAFNDNYFLRGKDTVGDDTYSDQVCTSRTDFTTQTWRYNLYNLEDGSLKKLNSGFPFTYTDASTSEQRYGHVGYWGIWTEDELAVTDLDGQTITKETFGDTTTPEEYTVSVGGGKLWKRTREASTYAEMAGVALNWWGDPDDPNCEFGCTSQGDYRATVVGGNLMVTHSITWGDNGPVLTDIADVNITPTTTGEQRWMWADNLGGSVVFNTDTVVFYKEEVVSPSDITDPITVFCYERCLKGGLDGTTVSGSNEDVLYNVLWNNGTQEASYTITTDTNGNIVLQDAANSNAEVSLATTTFDSTFLTAFPWYEWGAQSGEMVTTPVDPANWYTVFEAAETYRWETGPTDWSLQVVVKDSNGDVVPFDPPLQMTYTYAAGDDPNGDNFVDGTPFLLEYGGPGQLWGFPWEQSDPNCDPETEDCRWISALTLRNGVQLDANGSGSYVVKAIESEQNMVPLADTSECTTAGLSLDFADLSLPTTVDEDVTITMADKPTVTDAPAVIEGEVQ